MNKGWLKSVWNSVRGVIDRGPYLTVATIGVGYVCLDPPTEITSFYDFKESSRGTRKISISDSDSRWSGRHNPAYEDDVKPWLAGQKEIIDIDMDWDSAERAKNAYRRLGYKLIKSLSFTGLYHDESNNQDQMVTVHYTLYENNHRNRRVIRQSEKPGMCHAFTHNTCRAWQRHETELGILENTQIDNPESLQSLIVSRQGNVITGNFDKSPR